jgi:hypothetical protein
LSSKAIANIASPGTYFCSRSALAGVWRAAFINLLADGEYTASENANTNAPIVLFSGIIKV